MKGLMVRCVIAASVCGALVCAATAAPTKRATVTVSGYSGTTELTNFPVLVRISADRIIGFSYADCDLGGCDLSFADADGTLLAHEIDTWDEDGESLVWVNVPVVTNNASFVMRWSDANPTSVTASDTWNSDYVGVWHMGEADGVCANSTSHGSKYDATPMSNTVNSVLYDGSDAPIGGARTTANDTDCGYLSVPSYTDENVGDSFVVSGWVRMAIAGNSKKWGRIVSRKNTSNATGGGFIFAIEDIETIPLVWVRGGSDAIVWAKSSDKSFPSVVKTWVHWAVVFEGSTCCIYGNGSLISSGTISAAVDNGLPLTFGANSNGGGGYLRGALDECRLKKGVASADWVKAEYDTVKGDSFVTFGDAELINSDASSPVDFSIPIVERGDNYATLSAVVWSLGDGASSATFSCAYGNSAASLGKTAVSAAVDSTGRQTLSLTRLMPETTYYARLTLTNDKGESVTGEVFEITTLPSNDRNYSPSAAGLNQTFFTSANANWTKDYTTLQEGTDWTKYTDADRIYRRELGTIMAYVGGQPKAVKYTSEVWGDEVYWPVNGGQWAYWGYMYMEKGKSYKFRAKIDDGERVVVTNIATGAEVVLIKDTSWATDETSDAFVPTVTGWHPIEVRMSDGTGGLGGVDTTDNYRNSVNMGYSADGGETWSMLLDPGDGSLFRTSQRDDFAVTESVSSGTLSLALSFKALAPERTLAAVWGPAHGGNDSTNGWAFAAVVGKVADGETSVILAPPASWGSDDCLVLRYCVIDADGGVVGWSPTTYWHKIASRGMQIILR